MRKEKEGAKIMKDLLLFAAIMAGWFALNRYILPKFGVQT